MSIRIWTEAACRAEEAHIIANDLWITLVYFVCFTLSADESLELAIRGHDSKSKLTNQCLGTLIRRIHFVVWILEIKKRFGKMVD